MGAPASNPNKPVVFGKSFKTKWQRRKEEREAQRIADATVGRVFGYGRVSTDKQQLSLDAQERIVEAYIQWRFGEGGEEYVGWFADPDVSGKIPFEERDAGGAVFKALQRKDHVVVAKLDRAFRSFADAARCLEQWDKMGVCVHVVDYRIDTSTPFGKLMLQFLAMFAEFERNQISERTKAALRERKAQGKTMAKWHAALGFSMSKTMIPGKFNNAGRPVYRYTEYVNEYEMRLMRRIHIMHAGGETLVRIAKKLAEAGMKKRKGGTQWSEAEVWTYKKTYRKLLEERKVPAEFAPSALSNSPPASATTPSGATPLASTPAAADGTCST